MTDRGDHRIGDAEREQAIAALRGHTGAGRLTLEEFSDLAGRVYAARTVADLDAVAADLPPGVAEAAPGPTPPLPDALVPPGAAPAAPPGPRPPARRRFVAVMSGSRARGRWRAPARIGAFAWWGGVHVDLSRAELDGPVVDIVAWACMGAVHVVVPPGTRVELDGMVLMGGAANLTRSDAQLPDAPTVRVHARGLWGGVTVRTKREKRGRDERHGHRSRGERRGTGDQRPADSRDPRAAGIVDVPTILELPRHVLDDLATRLPDLTGAPSHHRARPGRSARPGPPSRSAPPPQAPAPPPVPGPPSWSASPPPPGAPVDGVVAGAGPAGNGDRPAPPSGTLTMMVTDIVGSTALAERVGDRRWIEVLDRHNALVRARVARHGGTEIKAQGDGFLVVFPSARRAILAAVEVQEAAAVLRDEHPEAPVVLRVGLHTGEIVDVDGDVLGQNVVVAVRIADQAGPGEVVVSGLTRDLTASGGDLVFGPAEEVELKGLSEPWRVHRVDLAAAGS